MIDIKSSFSLHMSMRLMLVKGWMGGIIVFPGFCRRFGCIFIDYLIVNCISFSRYFTYWYTVELLGRVKRSRDWKLQTVIFSNLHLMILVIWECRMLNSEGTYMSACGNSGQLCSAVSGKSASCKLDWSSLSLATLQLQCIVSICNMQWNDRYRSCIHVSYRLSAVRWASVDNLYITFFLSITCTNAEF